MEQFKDATIGFKGYTRLARSRGSGFGYLALLLLIVLAISAVIHTVQMKQQLASFDQQVAAAPAFGIRNGEFYFDGPQPHEFKDPRFPVLIDTTGKTSPDSLRQRPPGTTLITRDRVYQVSLQGDVVPISLSAFQGEVTKADLRRALKSLHMLVPVAFLFIYVFQLGAKALDAIILAALAMLFANSWRQKISFELGYKLALYAMTLPVVIQWIFPGFRSLSGSGFLIFWGLSLLYVTMGLRAYLRGEEPDEA